MSCAELKKLFEDDWEWEMNDVSFFMVFILFFYYIFIYSLLIYYCI